MRNIDFNKYQSALIIGNGFDLSLGLSTSYMDFVNSDEFQILLNMQNQLAIYLKVNAELQNWIDIENELKLYSKNEDNAKFKTEYEALCKQLVVYINNIDYSSINKNSKAYEVLSYSVFFFFKNIHSQVLIILLNYFLSCTYIVFPLFLFFLLFVRICNIAETYITS